MIDSINHLLVRKILVLPGHDRHVMASLPVGGGEQQMHFFDGSAEHRRDRQERSQDYGNTHWSPERMLFTALGSWGFLNATPARRPPPTRPSRSAESSRAPARGCRLPAHSR